MDYRGLMRLLHTNLSDLVPEGRRLPDAVWLQRHRGMVLLLALHAAGFAAFAIMRGAGVDRALLDSGPIIAAMALALLPQLSRRWRAAAAALGLLSCSALLVHLTGGLIESHFHFFLTVGAIALYQEWFPFLLAFAYVVVHHAVLGTVGATTIYNHPAAQARPLLWTAIHAGYVVAASAASVLSWRLSEKDRQRAERVLDATGDGIYGLDRAGRITFANAALCRMVGIRADELLGRDHHDVLGHASAAGNRLAAQSCSVCAAVTAGRGLRSQGAQITRRDGETVPIEYSGNLVWEKRQISGAVVTLRDLTEQTKLTRKALYDSLTGLPNRSLLLERLQRTVVRLRRERSLAAVLFCDLDRFKTINDTLGHAAGDELLIAVAARLQQAVRAHDTVARFGGDEFVILCTDVDSERDVLRIASRLTAGFKRPFTVAGQSVNVTTSVGIALTNDADQEPEDLLGEADTAMYRAKQRGLNCVDVYDDDLRARNQQREHMEADLREAIERGQLAVHYQPKINLGDGRLAGLEALVRWHHPQLGLVPAGEFVSCAEDSGLIVEIGAWVLRQSCEQLRIWRSLHRRHADLQLSVNLSAGQLADPNLATDVAAVLAATDTPPELLCFEISERILMEQNPTFNEALDALRRLGLRIAVDDFGTGLTSLSYLSHTPVHSVKVDGSFVGSLRDTPDSWSVVASAIGVSRSLGIACVAEGVEDQTQAVALRQLGCDQAQGYHFARPAPATDIDVLLAAETLQPQPTVVGELSVERV